MPITYSFVTRWETPAAVERVWHVLQDSLHWPQWWASFKYVEEVSKGADNGIGSVRRYTLRSPMGYTLTFCLELTHIIDNNLISGKASGELVGTGTWIMARTNDMTYIECQWEVATTKPWMNVLAFLLRPVFIYNHARVMRQGARYLAAKLADEVRVVD